MTREDEEKILVMRDYLSKLCKSRQRLGYCGSIIYIYLYLKSFSSVRPKMPEEKSTFIDELGTVPLKRFKVAPQTVFLTPQFSMKDSVRISGRECMFKMHVLTESLSSATRTKIRVRVQDHSIQVSTLSDLLILP